MDEVEGQNIDFLWSNRLALGKHSALAGVGGKGKYQVSLWRGGDHNDRFSLAVWRRSRPAGKRRAAECRR